MSRGHAQELTREQIIAQTMHPYAGPSARGVDPSTMQGKVLCGYQGWFTTPGDGADRGWFHWSKTPEKFDAKIDLWPDVSELDADERYDTPLKHADGSAAQVYSPFNK